MEFFGSYELLSILSESIKLLPKNGKLFTFIAISFILLYSGSFLLFNYSIQSLEADITATALQSFMPDPSSSDPNSFSSTAPSSLTPQPGFSPAQITDQLNHLREYFSLLIAVVIAFFHTLSIISFFSTLSTILVSAMSYNSKNLSLKELFVMIWRTWTRALITSFYVSGLAISYFVVVVMYSCLLMYAAYLPTFWVAILLWVPAFIFYLYLCVPWVLSIVVSVVEESCYGMEALGKAAALVKGKRVHGFLLNIFYNLVALIFFLGCKMILGDKGLAYPAVSVILFSVCYFINILLVVSYTVFYFQCKVQHGEEIELHGNLQYTKLPTTTTQLPNDLP